MRKHPGEISYFELSPSPKACSGPLAIHFFLFILGLSLGRSSFENANLLGGGVWTLGDLLHQSAFLVFFSRYVKIGICGQFGCWARRRAQQGSTVVEWTR